VQADAPVLAGAPENDEGLVLWWPCEVIDPWEPPEGFELRLQHVLALPPSLRAMCVPPALLARLLGALPGVAGAEEPGMSSGGGGSGGNTGAGRRAAAPPPTSRRLLLLWFGSGSFEWRPGQELVPFGECRKPIEGE
jgi:hypothetical protein